MTGLAPETQIASTLRERNIDVSYVRYADLFASGYGTLAILYYATQGQQLSRDTIVRLQTQDQCFATLESLRPVFAAQLPAPIAQDCAFGYGYRSFDI